MKTFEKEIEESHPCRVETNLSYEAEALAMKLVGERYKKAELVALVRWLITDSAKIAREEVLRHGGK